MLQIHNTITGIREEFIPIDGNRVNMYVCGITPYDKSHLGHGRCYVVFDIIRRYLEKKGYNVRYVQNITDVDDKIINKSRELKIDINDLVEKNINEFNEYCRKLNIKPADSYPRVSRNIPNIINVISALVEKGFAYVSEGDVYYSVKKFSQYGKLSKRNIEELKVGARISPDEKKNDALDFALWKKTKPDEPQSASWDSPWGKGRPGWHIECSVMSVSELKTETLDIHGGGQDLIFPHHENEIAQTESYTGKPFAKYWIHNGFITINKEKMSKSLGNFFELGELLSNHDPMVVRLFLISVHYTGPLDFTEDKLLQSKSTWERITRIKYNTEILMEIVPDGGIDTVQKNIVDNLVKEFFDSMDNDFNTAEALAKIHGIINLLNALGTDKKIKLTKTTLNYALNRIIELCEVLGLVLPQTIKIDKAVLALVNERENARKNKNWQESDKLRSKLDGMDYIVEDTTYGPRIRKK